MKKILFVAMTLFCSSSFAENLTCLDSYKTFENIKDEAIQTWMQGSFEQAKELDVKYDYSALFHDKHPGNYYFASDWIDKKTYDSTLSFLISLTQNGQFKHIQSTRSKPKANFISVVGEVCVVPTQSIDMTFGEKTTTDTDVIYVRALADNQWRLLEYAGDERKEDFDEFFPDFPKTVKLLASSTVDDSGRSLTSTDVALKLFEYQGREITPEILNELQMMQKEIDNRKLKNGFK